MPWKRETEKEIKGKKWCERTNEKVLYISHHQRECDCGFTNLSVDVIEILSVKVKVHVL